MLHPRNIYTGTSDVKCLYPVPMMHHEVHEVYLQQHYDYETLGAIFYPTEDYLHVWAYDLWLLWVVAKQGNCAVGAVVSPKCENSLFLLLYSLGIIKIKYEATIPTNKFEISYNNLILESPIVVGFVYGFLKPFTLHTMKSAYFMRIQKKHMLPCALLRGLWWTWTRDCFMVSTT